MPSLGNLFTATCRPLPTAVGAKHRRAVKAAVQVIPAPRTKSDFIEQAVTKAVTRSFHTLPVAMEAATAAAHYRHRRLNDAGNSLTPDQRRALDSARQRHCHKTGAYVGRATWQEVRGLLAIHGYDRTLMLLNRAAHGATAPLWLDTSPTALDNLAIIDPVGHLVWLLGKVAPTLNRRRVHHAISQTFSINRMHAANWERVRKVLSWTLTIGNPANYPAANIQAVCDTLDRLSVLDVRRYAALPIIHELLCALTGAVRHVVTAYMHDKQRRRADHRHAVFTALDLQILSAKLEGGRYILPKIPSAADVASALDDLELFDNEDDLKWTRRQNVTKFLPGTPAPGQSLFGTIAKIPVPANVQRADAKFKGKRYVYKGNSVKVVLPAWLSGKSADKED